MKHLLFLSFLCVFFSALGANHIVLDALDDAIAAAYQYDSEHVENIEEIKRKMASTMEDDRRYELNQRIFELYQFFQADSAMKYAKENVAIAERLNDKDKLAQSKLMLADVTARSGLFHEAANIVDSIEMPVSDGLLRTYYFTKYLLCQYESEYVSGTDYEGKYFHDKMVYADSVIMLSANDSFEFKTILAALYSERDQKPEKAVEIITDVLPHFKPGMREYSVLTSQLGFAYGLLGDKQESIDCLAQSARSDIMGSIKENTAIRALANILMDCDEVDRANQYMNKSIIDANFYTARMRNLQSANILPVVTEAYQSQQSSRYRLLVCVIVLVSLIAAIIVFSYMVIKRQYRNLAESHAQLNNAQHELTLANQRISVANYELERMNHKLEESNVVKQTYMAQFIWMSSLAINKMERFRNKISLLVKNNQKHELSNALSSSREIADMSEAFYEQFDKAVLSVMPDFITKLNTLLTTPLQSKGGSDSHSALSTEQRIFALIRLGITDNQKIADFLHCSISTIYTYRSKVKARALDPANFEAQVAKI